jgi:hypothetical protein
MGKEAKDMLTKRLYSQSFMPEILLKKYNPA